MNSVRFNTAKRSAFEYYLRTGRKASTIDGHEGIDVEVKFNPYHDPDNGQFTFAPGNGPGNDSRTRRTETRRSTAQPPPKAQRQSGASRADPLPHRRKVNLDLAAYQEQHRALWQSVEGNSDKGFNSSRAVTEAAEQARDMPPQSNADVEAPDDLRAFVREISRITAEARISGEQNREKVLTFGRDADGKIVVTSVGVSGELGGRIDVPPRAIGVAHVHYAGLVQEPFIGDNSVVTARSIPSFVIAAQSGVLWEVGRQSGRYVQRIVRRDNSVGPWMRFAPR